MAAPECRLIALSEQPFDVCFHPTRQLVAAGVITGHVETFDFSPPALGKVVSRPVHAESCRAVRFLPGGAVLASAGSDGLLAFSSVERSKVLTEVKEAHGCAINKLEVLSDVLVATGDDEGHVRLWDTRTHGRTATFRVHEDFVADMYCCGEPRQALLTASGDGTLTHLDLRAGKVIARSDNQEDELLSVTLMKRGKKIVVGSQEGVLSLFNWGDIGDISDRFPGHPQSVDALLALDEDILISGSSDGVIRILSVLPNRMLGVVGEHSEWPVERLALSADRGLLASASHDNTLKLWDISYLREGGGEEEEEEGEAAAAAAPRAAAKGGAEGRAARAAAAAAGGEAEAEGEEGKRGNKRRKGMGKAKGAAPAVDFGNID